MSFVSNNLPYKPPPQPAPAPALQWPAGTQPAQPRRSKMVTKPRKDSSEGDTGGEGASAQFASTVRESAQQIWLAGLGAFSKAQEEGGKVFQALVKEGVSLQRRTQETAEE